MERKTILVLFGGCSGEHEVSLVSAHAVLRNMDPLRYDAVAVGITREGRWLRYTGDLERLPANSWLSDEAACTPCTLLLDRGERTLMDLDGSGRRIRLDGAFPVLHGKNGEDVTVQGLLELAGIPIVGCGSLSSALCMDKDRSHRLAAAAGVRVPESALFTAAADRAAVHAAAGTIGYPVFVKPVRSGSSLGVTRVEREEALDRALEEALLEDSEVLLEEAIEGFEVGCAVMGSGGALTVGEVDEIELSQGFFNFEEKYTLKTSAIHCPARIAPEKASEIKETAKVLYRALGCEVLARVDLFLTPEGSIVFNEINTIPGFTSHSRYPTMMARAGIPFPELVARLIELGTARQ